MDEVESQGRVSVPYRTNWLCLTAKLTCDVGDIHECPERAVREPPLQHLATACDGARQVDCKFGYILKMGFYKPPLCKGRWICESKFGGVGKRKKQNNPPVIFDDSPLYTRGPTKAFPLRGAECRWHWLCDDRGESRDRGTACGG